MGVFFGVRPPLAGRFGPTNVGVKYTNFLVNSGTVVEP